MKEMDEQIVKNARLHGEYSFFPADVAVRGAPVADPYEAHDEMLMGDGEDEDKENEMDEDDDEMCMAV